MARLPDDEVQRRFQVQKAIFQDSITPQQALERWPEQTPTERERRRKASELQQARYNTVVDDDTGQRMLGGPQKSTTVRGTKAIMEAVAELADGERQKEVIDALFAPLSDESKAVRGKGAERIVKIAAEQSEVERRDREELRQLGKDDLVARLVKGIMGSGSASDLMAGLIKASQQRTIEATTHSDVDASEAA